MPTSGDIIKVLGTTAPAGDLMGATYQAALNSGFNEVEAAYLARLDAMDEARAQGSPAFLIDGLQRDAEQFLTQNTGALQGLLGLTSAQTPEAAAGTAGPSASPTGAAALPPLIGAPGEAGELNIPYGSDYLPYSIDLYKAILSAGTQRELTMAEIQFQREVEGRLGREFTDRLKLEQQALDQSAVAQGQDNTYRNRALDADISQFNQQFAANREDALAGRQLDVAGRMASLRANPLSAAESVLYQDEINGLGPSALAIQRLLQSVGGAGIGAPAPVGSFNGVVPAGTQGAAAVANNPAMAAAAAGAGITTPGGQVQTVSGTPLNANIDVGNFVRSATQGGGGSTAVGLGGLEATLPRTLGGAELNRMSNEALGVFDSFSAAGGNPNAVARSARALVPAAFQGVGAGV